ncbi:MAG: hypothetical protein OEL89_03405, partial [Candidatus Peregrinibacteria bacterium]|nr:hypothetical protein [Candidatus Peregrinibacteria bacterium]
MVMLRKNGLFSMVKSFFSEDGSFMDKAMGLFSGEDEEKEEFKSDLQQKNEEELVGIKEKVKVREKDEFVDSNWDKWKKGFEGKIDIKGFFGVSNGQESVDVGAKGKLKSNFDSKADVETFLEKLNNVNNKYMNWGWDFENVLQVVNKEGGVKFEDGKVKVKVDGEIKGFEKDDQDDFEKEMKKEEVLKELQAYKDFKDNNAKFGCEFKDLPDEVFVDVGTKGQFNEKFKGVLKSDFVEGLDKEGIKKYFRKLEKIGSSDEMDMPESDLEEILDMNKSEWKEVSWLNPKKYWRTFNTMRKIDPKDSIDLGNWLRGTKGTKGKAFWESQYSTLREWIWKSNNK